MGTPDFALPALNALHQSDHAVELVITQPDRPVGRGRRISSPPVKTAATALDLPLAQVPDMKHPAILDRLGDIAPDILVVVAFGHRLPAAVLEIPALMPINIHASLLPRYRGPAPIQWAIINGETESGVTTMRMDTGMDTGDILMRAPTPIGPKESAGLLHDRLAAMGADLLLKTLSALEQGSLTPQPQNHDLATHAPMLSKADGRIDWAMPARSIERRIRGLDPWPGAYAFHGDRRLRLISASVVGLDQMPAPGTVVRRFPDELVVAAGEQAIRIDTLQGPSGKRLTAADFLRGYAIEHGEVLH